MNDYVAESIDYGPLETKISFCLASAPTRKDVHIHKVNLEDPDTYWQRLENPDNSDMQMNINLERENLDIDLGNLSSNPPLELDQILAKFLEIPTSSTILLLGECGLGKSLSIYRLTDRLLSRWWAYFRNPEGLMPYFPIFIRSKLNKWSHSALCNIIEKIWSHYNLSEKLIQEAKWLVIIDGYEECQIDLKPQNLPKLIGLNDLPNAKLVVTCRSGAVKALDLHNRFAFNESLMVYYFLPFNIFQMLKYLKNNLSWDAFDYNYNYKLLKHDQKLFANLRNPFMLSLLAQSVKVSKKDFAMLNCWQIYQNFVENYIDTQYQLLPYAVQRLFKVELPSIVESFNKFAAEVAFSAFEEGNIALEIDSYQTLSTNSQKWINLNRLVLEDSQKQFKVNQQSRSNHRALLSEQEYVAIMQHRLNQFKNKLPLIDKGTSYEFVHKSFFEYFVARHIVYLIIKYKKITSEKGDAHEQQIAIEEGIKLLNYRNLQSEPEILNFIVEGCKEENIMVCKEFLLQIIKHSEQISNTHQAYINAHNIFKVLCVFEEPFINTAHIPDNNDIVNLMELFEKLSILDDADTKNGQKILMFSSGLQYTPIQPYFNKEAIISKNGSVTEHAAEVDYVRYTPSVGILPVSQHR